MDIVKKIRAKAEDWRKTHPGMSSPWDAHSLDKQDPKDKTIWLNPGNQQHLNCGWMTAEDLQDWLDGKPGRVIKSQEHWDELLFMCKSGMACLIGYDLEYFNLFPTEYLLHPGQRLQDGETIRVGTGLPSKLMLAAKKYEYPKMNPVLIRMVEGHTKWMVRDYFRSQVSQGVDPYDLRTSRNLDEEIYGFFYCLQVQGCGPRTGYCNTPAVRENFSWWKDLLKREALWELWIEKGLAYEPWVKNKKSLFSRIEGRDD